MWKTPHEDSLRPSCEVVGYRESKASLSPHRSKRLTKTELSLCAVAKREDATGRIDNEHVVITKADGCNSVQPWQMKKSGYWLLNPGFWFVEPEAVPACAENEKIAICRDDRASP